VDTFDWTVNSAVAAAENEPLSTTARKERTWRRSIGHFLSGERMGEAGAGCGLVRPFDGDRRTLSSAVHSGRSRNCYSITKRDTSYRGYMLDKLREVFHNVVNAIAVLPPSTDDSKDLTPISPPVGSIPKELAFRPAPSFFLSHSVATTVPLNSEAHNQARPTTKRGLETETVSVPAGHSLINASRRQVMMRPRTRRASSARRMPCAAHSMLCGPQRAPVVSRVRSRRIGHAAHA